MESEKGDFMEQNSFFWLVPQGGQPSLPLKKGESAAFDFIQCFDGRFSYDVWVYGLMERDVNLGLALDGQALYSSMRLQASGEKCWRQLGNLQATKGEHRAVVSAVNRDCVLEGLLICRSTDYVQGGMATQHLPLIAAGGDILALLQEAGLLEQQREKDAEKTARLKRLDKYGFLERFDQDASEGRCRCGVPMGGIGAGKIELDSEGVLTAITINNNCEVPVYKTRGSFFGAWARPVPGGTQVDAVGETQGSAAKNAAAEPAAMLLQTADPGGTGLPLADSIDFQGRFPRAKLVYYKEGFPAQICLRAFSGLVPYDQKESSLPAVTYEFTVENPTEQELEAAVLFSFENLIGTGGSMAYQSKNPDYAPTFIMNSWNPGYVWCDRRGNRQRAFSLEGREGIFFDTAGGDHGDPASLGDYTLLCAESGSDVEISRAESFDVWKDTKKIWTDFARDGVLGSMCAEGTEECGTARDRTSCAPDGHCAETAFLCGTEDIYPAGAMAAKVRLKPHERRKITFIFAWNMPCYPDVSGKDMGVYYSNFFSSSREAALYMDKNRQRIYEGTTAFERYLAKSTLPEWLQEKLINDRFPIYTCSWFTKDGKFSINEAPAGMMGCLGTMDQRLACNSLYTNFYPALDDKELTLFADVQGEDGSISHDLGFGEFAEGPRKGNWSDLCSSFILQVYKHYLYTGNRAFLERMYGNVKRAVSYQLSTDDDQNGIPDVGAGRGTTYDTYHWYGTSAFVASLWIAELAVCERMALALEDADFAAECSARRKQACEQMEKELWTDRYPFGGYYKNYHDALGGRVSENCFIAQLAGEWFADLMDVESGLTKERVKEALGTIYERNVDIRDIVIMNDETTPEGDFYGFGYTFLQYDEVYYGCLAIYRDMIREGMRIFEKVWQRTKDAQWNIGLTYYTDGRFCGLPYYMTNPASLFLLEALSGWMPDAANGVLKIFPHTQDGRLVLPLFSPRLWLMLDYEKKDGRAVYGLEVLRLPDKSAAGDAEKPLGFATLVLRADFAVGRALVEGSAAAFVQDKNRVTLQKTFVPAAGEKMVVVLEEE